MRRTGRRLPVLPPAANTRTALVLLAALLLSLHQAPAANAQSTADAACAAISERLENQRAIIGDLHCQAHIDPAETRRISHALNRCTSPDRAFVTEHANRQGRAIEACIQSRLREARAPSVERRGGTEAARADTGQRPPERPPEHLGATPDSRPREQTTRTPTERIRDLLAEAPPGRPPIAGEESVPAPRDLTFRSGLVWSYGGRIANMHCIHWNEPSDPHSWEDNFLCTDRDVGLQWSYRGPILGRGLNCILVREKSDPHDWHDNYFCWPRDLKVAFRFSATGRIEGMRCVAIVEPSDPHTWRDNYLCYQGEE